MEGGSAASSRVPTAGRPGATVRAKERRRDGATAGGIGRDGDPVGSGKGREDDLPTAWLAGLVARAFAAADDGRALDRVAGRCCAGRARSSSGSGRASERERGGQYV